jgi:hypothetical protein
VDKVWVLRYGCLHIYCGPATFNWIWIVSNIDIEDFINNIAKVCDFVNEKSKAFVSFIGIMAMILTQVCQKASSPSWSNALADPVSDAPPVNVARAANKYLRVASPSNLLRQPLTPTATPVYRSQIQSNELWGQSGRPATHEPWRQSK